MAPRTWHQRTDQGGRGTGHCSAAGGSKVAVCAGPSPQPPDVSEGHLRYCGREFTWEELEVIRGLIGQADRFPTRAAISRAVCEALGWRRRNGQLKDMSARVALLRMHRDGLLRLPRPRNGNGNGSRRPVITSRSDPRPRIEGTRRDLGRLALRRVSARGDSRLWNELVERYHYLGYAALPGAQARYLIVDGREVLGVIGLGAGAWKVAARDRFIGWTPKEREQNLHLVVNQARFLILPWVAVANLASSVLAMMARRVRVDWVRLYGYRPVLLETFVERGRFHGTCYRAANWIHVGCTQGRGKLDRRKRFAKPVKAIFVYPLEGQFRTVLCSDGPDGGGAGGGRGG